MKYILQLISLAFLLLINVTTRCETLDCTPITSLPYVITLQGIYCFTGNLSTSMTSGNAIEIQTNNVTIDLNGYKLGGLGAGDGTQTNGIYTSQRKNITIKNGIVRGFLRGIYLNDNSPYTTSSGHVVKSILADQNTLQGIVVMGLGNTISNNTVVDTGGSTVAGGGYGISVYGASAKVVINDISQTQAQASSTSYGIYMSNADYALVQNNTVTDTIRDTGTSYAILITSSIGVFMRNNNVANADYGINYSGSTGKYFNNLTFDVATPFSGGTAIGSNNN